MSDELEMHDRVGTVICGNSPCVTNRSKYIWISGRVSICNKSMLKSPVITTSLMFLEIFEITGFNS